MNGKISEKNQDEKNKKKNKENNKVSFIENIKTKKELYDRKKHSSKKLLFESNDLPGNEIASPQNKNKIRRSITFDKEIIEFSLDFVPRLKPIKIKLVPSKLYLDEKRYPEKYESCPCSQYYDSDDEEDSPQKLENNQKESIKDTRKFLVRIKDLTKMKDSIPHIKTEQIINNNNILENANIDNIYNEINNEDNFPDIETNDLTPKIKDFDITVENNYNRNFSFSCVNNNDNNDNNLQSRKKSNSISIIEVLKMKNKNENNK